jgi:cytochrome c peroxidase
MGSNWEEVVAKLNNDELFKNMFDAINPKGVTVEAIVKAITTYEESLVTPGSDIDRYLLGDSSALSPQQKRGLEKFNNFGCITCHQGVNIGGNLFQKIGRIDKVSAQFSQDLGRYGVTGQEHDKYVFKVPSLRNVVHTAPYFHNGEVKTLYEAIQLMGRVQLGRELSSADIEDIEALLHAFSADLEGI